MQIQTDQSIGNDRQRLTRSPMSMDNKFLRNDELAEWLGVSPRLIRYWRQKGIIPFLKVGAVVLFDPAKVRASLDAYEQSAKPRIITTTTEVQP